MYERLDSSLPIDPLNSLVHDDTRANLRFSTTASLRTPPGVRYVCERKEIKANTLGFVSKYCHKTNWKTGPRFLPNDPLEARPWILANKRKENKNRWLQIMTRPHVEMKTKATRMTSLQHDLIKITVIRKPFRANTNWFSLLFSWKYSWMAGDTGSFESSLPEFSERYSRSP